MTDMAKDNDAGVEDTVVWISCDCSARQYGPDGLAGLESPVVERAQDLRPTRGVVKHQPVSLHRHTPVVLFSV